MLWVQKAAIKGEVAGGRYAYMAETGVLAYYEVRRWDNLDTVFQNFDFFFLEHFENFWKILKIFGKF